MLLLNPIKGAQYGCKQDIKNAENPLKQRILQYFWAFEEHSCLYRFLKCIQNICLLLGLDCGILVKIMYGGKSDGRR